MELKSKSIIGIVGRSGSGKSTFVKLLARLFKPNNGRILIDDIDIQKVELSSLRRQIGFVSQEPNLISEDHKKTPDQTMIPPSKIEQNE